MAKYKLIIEYLKKGNNFTQVATLCGCSRMTVWRVVQRLNSLTIELVDYSDTLSITLDTVKPVGVLYSGTTAVTSGTKSTASYIKYVASDSLSGINAIYVKKPGATSYVTYTNGEQITENGTYSFYCTDKAGCRSDTLTIYLDNIKPTLSISNGSFGGTLSDSFSVTASDNISGVTLYFKAPNGSNFVKVSGTTMSVSKIMPDGTYQFYAVDGYGNTSATYSVTLSI